MTSSSRPSSVTNKISCLISGIMAPTQGAKEPSMAMLIELGTNPAANVWTFLVSKIKAEVSLAAASKAAGERACWPRSKTLSIESYP